MGQETDLLAAFLAEHDRPAAAASAYLDWLDRQGDGRGEYLRLLLALGEPADARTGGPERLRLRQLRGQVDAKWAGAIDRTRLRPGGLYQADEPGSSSFLRFYPDGVVLSVSSTGTADQVWKWLTAEAGQYEGRWTLGGDQLSFFIRHGKLMDPEVMHPQWSGDLEGWQAICEANNAECMQKRVEYAGVIGQRTLALRWHSYLNGADGAGVFRFVRIGDTPSTGTGKGGAQDY